MSRRHLLLCFDAFDTLFTPKRPVHLQYAEVARALGVTNFNEDDIKTSFRNAFKAESKNNPNYGKDTGLNATKWWTHIIHNTFQPFLRAKEDMPKDLAPQLIHRFWSEEGYALFPDVKPLLKAVHGDSSRTSRGSTNERRIVVGVITNSDPRVPDVLSSLGLTISPLRYGQASGESTSPNGAPEGFDIDFSVMSYDVGAEKPDGRIFKAAEQMLRECPQAQGTDAEAWDRVYVGDDYDKDVLGAIDAGWNAVYVARSGRRELAGVRWLERGSSVHLMDTFQDTKAVGVDSLDDLARWLR